MTRREFSAVFGHDLLGVVTRCALTLHRMARRRQRAEVSGDACPVASDGGGAERRSE